MTPCRTGKTPYTSKDRARKAMVRLRARLRTYQCGFCGHWHLTKGG